MPRTIHGGVTISPLHIPLYNYIGKGNIILMPRINDPISQHISFAYTYPCRIHQIYNKYIFCVEWVIWGVATNCGVKYYRQNMRRLKKKSIINKTRRFLFQCKTLVLAEVVLHASIGLIICETSMDPQIYTSLYTLASLYHHIPPHINPVFLFFNCHS